MTETVATRAVPKPQRPVAVLQVSRLAAHRLAEAQGRAFQDISADLDAADALETARIIDRQRDPHLLQVVRFFCLIRQEPGNALAYATLGEGHAREAIRLDRIKDEHDRRAEVHVDDSIEHGRTARGACAPSAGRRCRPRRRGRRHPRADEMEAAGVVLLPCALPKHLEGRCCFLSEGGDNDV